MTLLLLPLLLHFRRSMGVSACIIHIYSACLIHIYTYIAAAISGLLNSWKDNRHWMRRNGRCEALTALAAAQAMWAAGGSNSLVKHSDQIRCIGTSLHGGAAPVATAHRPVLLSTACTTQVPASGKILAGPALHRTWCPVANTPVQPSTPG